MTAIFVEPNAPNGMAAIQAGSFGSQDGERLDSSRRVDQAATTPPSQRWLDISGVDWHTAWDAIEVEAKARTKDPAGLAGVRTLGVDEHIWRPSRIGVDRAVTIMVDLTRDQAGCLHARLLDAVVGRSGTVYRPG